MDNAAILKRVDHTLLKPTATWAQICALCDEAIACGTASVCVPPAYVGRIHAAYGGRLVICTVIGFPLGYDVLEAKLAAVKSAIASGAGEIDMVVNLTDVKNGAFDQVTQEIAAIKRACADKPLKVIVEACYLTQEEKIALCQCVTKAKADFIKTSTGFGPGGALMEDVLLFKAHIGPDVRIKAAGGIRSREDMARYIEAGCERLGTSAAVKLLKAETQPE